MSVLDLFSGLGGWSSAFKERGHYIETLDLDPHFHPTYAVDILDVDSISGYDVILASPPCEVFSIAAVWKKNFVKRGTAYRVNNTRTELMVQIMKHTFQLIDTSDATYYFIENPRGMMRKVAPRKPITTVWYCQYGMEYAKPTDIWTNAQIWWRPTCSNSNYYCKHARARRSAKFGIQGIRVRKAFSDGIKDPALRAIVPYQLSLHVCTALESHPPTFKSLIDFQTNTVEPFTPTFRNP